MGNIASSTKVSVVDALAHFRRAADQNHLNLRLQWGAEWTGTAQMMLRVLLEITSEGPICGVVMDDTGHIFHGDITWTGSFRDGYAADHGKLQIGAALLDLEEVWAIAI